MKTHINYTMKEEKKASSITILPSSNHEVNIAMLYKHIGDTIIIHNGILRLRISLENTNPPNYYAERMRIIKRQQ